MRLEHIPIILGVLIAMIGLALVADAWIPDDTLVPLERRRRQRAERHRGGEALVGIGTLCLSAALIGRDTWRYGTLAVLIGTLLLLAGGVLNRRFLREVVFFRGAARRAPDGSLGAFAADRERPLPREAEAGNRPESGTGPPKETTPPARPRIR